RCTSPIIAHFTLLRPVFFDHAATTESYTLSLHDALPIWRALAKAQEMRSRRAQLRQDLKRGAVSLREVLARQDDEVVKKMRVARSEEHTSELQSRENLVCRLLLEKKKDNTKTNNAIPPHA